LHNLFDELKRRNVIRVAAAYAVAAWVVLQIADLVLENIGAPEWVMQTFMLLIGLGFPLAVIFSWAYELTPEGLKLEKDVDHDQSITQRTANKLDKVTVGLLIVVLVIFGFGRLVPREEATAPAETADTTVANVTDKSIAVLAFEDLSPGGDQAYFAEGISEELLNVLAQIPDLKVAGRTSSFAFKDQARDLREIGEILEVAHILEGSVRTSGDRVRVTAQLVKADDGFHLFSRNYDRELTDIFEVQDDIAQEIVKALRATILGEQSIERPTETSVEAYEKYLQARQWIHTRDRGLMEGAAVLLDETLVIDPDYAPALAQKALALILLSNADGAYGDIPAEVALRMSRPLLDRALELEPNLADAHAILGLWHSNNSVESSEEAIASFRKALEINPTMPNANNWLAGELDSADSYAESQRLYEFVVEHDPLYRPAFTNLTFNYVQTRSTEKADALIRRVERISGGSPNVLFARGSLNVANAELAAGTELLAKAYEFNRSGSVTQLWYAFALTLLGEYDTASEVANDTDKLMALELAGRSDAAQEVFDSLQLLFFDEDNLRGIGDWMLMQDRPEDLIALLEDQAGIDDDWIAAQPRPTQLWGAGHLTNLAYALRATGRDEEAERVLTEIRELLDAQLRNGADNLFFHFNAAEYAALTGDVDAMLTSLRKAIDYGIIDIGGFYNAPFNRYRGNPRFIELEQESIRLANVERRKLGMQEI
jgi:TolB-like protein